MVLGERCEFFESRFPLGITGALVFEYVGACYTTMATHLGQLMDFSRVQQFDQMRTRDVKQVCCVLSRHGLVVFNDANVFTGKEQLC